MLRLGIVTYNIAKDWDLATILSRLEKLGYEGVELRTSHKHGVESTLSEAERAEVRKRFDASPVELAGLGTAFEFQSPDPAEVKKNIDGAMDYVRLAHDLGCRGIKVRPNGVPKGQQPEPTFRRIGQALSKLGEQAGGYGIEVRVEVHGAVTQEWPNFAQIMRFADHPNVFTCWNSNPTDVMKDGSIAANFKQVAGRIREVHLRDLTDAKYPWRELFALLKGSNYDGFTLAEIPESPDPERVLSYFKALWMAYQPGKA